MLSKPSETTVIPEETRKLLSRFSDQSALPRVKVCSLLSLDFADVIGEIQPDLQALEHFSHCLRCQPATARPAPPGRGSADSCAAAGRSRCSRRAAPEICRLGVP